MAKSYSVIGVEGFPLVQPGDDIGQLITTSIKYSDLSIDDGDIIAVSQKIVSKAEGRLVNIADVKPSRRTERLARFTRKDPRLVECVLKESRRVLGTAERALVVETPTGLICLNAGMDKSNISGSDTYSLLPSNPDSSAQSIRTRLRELTGKNIGVIVCDTYSRPLRNGIVEFAIGIAGVTAFKDYRGTRDLFGNELKFKLVAVADEMAAAAELVMGQGSEGMPVAIIKGLGLVVADSNVDPESSELLMPTSRDLYRGTIR